MGKVDALDIELVGVVGCGMMGAGIAEVCSRAGRSVVVVELDEFALDRGRQRLAASLQRAVEANKLSAADAEAVLARIVFSTDFSALSDRQLVIEAVVESEPEKLSVFQTLDKVVEVPDAVLASNTSSIPIMKLAMVTSRPEQVLGLHFFNPAPVLPLVEVVASLLTSPASVATTNRFVTEGLGKHAVLSKDRAGFIVNALLVPYLLSAIRMLESGFASAQDIDTGMTKGCAHPMGPLALSDLIGLDTTMAVAESLYQEFREPLYAPPPLLVRMVEAGLLGQKAGRGFFEYS